MDVSNIEIKVDNLPDSGVDKYWSGLTDVYGLLPVQDNKKQIVTRKKTLI